MVGCAETLGTGVTVGSEEGDAEGRGEGIPVQKVQVSLVGMDVGTLLGTVDGRSDGDGRGINVGNGTGTTVGAADGPMQDP
jgi:hypothetical protein